MWRQGIKSSQQFVETLGDHQAKQQQPPPDDKQPQGQRVITFCARSPMMEWAEGRETDIRGALLIRVRVDVEVGCTSFAADKDAGRSLTSNDCK